VPSAEAGPFFLIFNADLAAGIRFIYRVSNYHSQGQIATSRKALESAFNPKSILTAERKEDGKTTQLVTRFELMRTRVTRTQTEDEQMRTRRIFQIAFAGGVVALALQLGAGAAQAATVNFAPDDPTRATGIENLSYDGDVWNVTFTSDVPALSVYGSFPGEYDFTTNSLAEGAVDAVNIELEAAGAETVGDEELLGGLHIYRVGFESFIAQPPVGPEVESVWYWEGTNPDLEPWGKPTQPDANAYNLDAKVWADFTRVPSDLLLGDVNLDDSVNGLDVDPFVALVTDGTYQAEGDMNEDSAVNGLDVDPFVAAVLGGGVQAVPEPGTALLLVLGLLGFGVVARKWGK
jgi:hypothetical protein